VAALKYSLIGLGAAGAGMAVTLNARSARICGWYDRDDAVRSVTDMAGGLSFEGLCGHGVVPLPPGADSAAAAIAGSDIVLVSTTADCHATVAREITPAVSADQIVVLHCGYVGGSKVFADALASAGAPADIAIFELNNTLHLAGKPDPATVVIRGEKRWLELAGLPAGRESPHYAALLAQFPEFAYSANVLENGLNNPNCIGHVPAYVGGAMTLDRDMGDLTTGILQFEEARMGRVNLIAAAFEAERDTVMRAAGLTPLPITEFSRRAYPAGSRLYGGIARFGPKLQRRYLHEDVPCSLVPLELLGRLVATATPLTSGLIDIANILEGVDFRATGRNADVLSAEWMRSYCR